MRKLKKAGMLFIMLTVLTACTTACAGGAASSGGLTGEGIAPYELSESERYILQSFNMDSTSQIISFHAPEEAVSLKVNVYRLGADGKWENSGGTAVSTGAVSNPAGQLSGTFTMQLRENHAIDFNITTDGIASFKTGEILLESEEMSSATGFLQEFQTIGINTEIPVALMVYDSGTSMESYSLQDYFEPSKFEGLELVQAVTLEFCDK